MRTRIAALLAACLMFGTPPSSLAQDYTAGGVSIEHPWTRATPPMANVAGGFMILRNEGDTADRLVGGSTPIADRVEVHHMEMEGDVMRMREVPEGLEIPAGGEAEFAPGGYHLMLIGLKAPLTEGERVPLTLEFQTGGTVEVELAVNAMGAGSGTDAHGGH